MTIIIIAVGGTRDPAQTDTNDASAVPTTTTPADPLATHASLTDIDGITVNVQIADNVRSLLDLARADGIHLAGWGYRTHDQQIQLRRQHCGTSEYATYQMP
ncbi:MAG TPA: hypothetical protein VGJ86_03800, partial [Acidimicrobiales bacterium]